MYGVVVGGSTMLATYCNQQCMGDGMHGVRLGSVIVCSPCIEQILSRSP